MRFKSILIAFFSFVYIAFIGITSAAMFCIAFLIKCLTFFFDKRLIILNLFSSFWASLYIWCMPMWRVRIYGRNKLDMSKSYVFVSNHQSQLDILVAYRLFFPFRWISKSEIFRLPFIGWNMILNGHVAIKRGNKHSVAQMMDQCEQLLKNNISIIIFPEGTRSKTGHVQPFKPGAFILAKNMKKPIQPLVINRTKNALPKHTMKLQKKTEMTLTVLDEIPYDEFKMLEVDQIAQMVREKIMFHVEEHKHESLTAPAMCKDDILSKNIDTSLSSQ